MASLNDLLARWLLRRLRHRPAGDLSDRVGREALLAQFEEQQALITRLKTTDEQRESRHQAQKKKHEILKQELEKLREAHEASEIQLKQISQLKQALESALSEQLSLPNIHPLPHGERDQELRRFIQNNHKVWQHEMRLGVLRQHEPKPMDKEPQCHVSPPGDEASWPRVSVVTPSFQQAAFIERTLRSVFEQDYPRLEYRVIDGGSKDTSVDVIRHHESKLAGWTSERDTGPANAVNRGFAQTSGDIMAWINSDDLMLPGTLRYVANYFARHPDVDVVYGHRLIIDERDWQVGRWVLPRHDGEALLWVDYVPQETLFWRRSIWNKIGARLDEAFQFAFDWDLLLRFQKAGARIVRLPRFLGAFRVHDAQKSTADMSSVGMIESTRLRARELGDRFDETGLARRTVLTQQRALWCDKLLRLGIRW